MLEAFSCTSALKASLRHPDAPKAIHQCGEVLSLFEESRGTLRSDERFDSSTPSDKTGINLDVKQRKMDRIPMEVIAELAAQEDAFRAEFGDQWKTPSHAFSLSTLKLQGKTFTAGSSGRSDGVVFVRSSSGRVNTPGVLHNILIVPLNLKDTGSPLKGEKERQMLAQILVVYPFKLKDDSIRDPFSAFPDFGATLRRKECNNKPLVLPALSKVLDIRMDQCVFRPWDERHLVLKALSRVRDFALTLMIIEMENVCTLGRLLN